VYFCTVGQILALRFITGHSGPSLASIFLIAPISYRGKIGASEANMRFLIFVLLIVVSVLSVSAQTRPVTNADLEKYRLEREKAERDYRDNYARLGFPSPAELAQRRKKALLEDQVFADKLRAERFEAERRGAGRQRLAAYFVDPTEGNSVQALEQPYFWSYSRRYRGQFHPVYSQPGYYAGGQFWPTPVRRPMRTPVWLPRR
jgi:hypothetical protein